MKFTTSCDMGNVKIFTNEVSLFFDNGLGDCPTVVEIFNKEPDKIHNFTFLGHFTVKEKDSVYLSGYDCEDDPIHTFDVGRWFVHRHPTKPQLAICKVDSEIHA